jgi:hypothetical protein
MARSRSFKVLESGYSAAVSAASRLVRGGSESILQEAPEVTNITIANTRMFDITKFLLH